MVRMTIKDMNRMHKLVGRVEDDNTAKRHIAFLVGNIIMLKEMPTLKKALSSVEKMRMMNFKTIIVYVKTKEDN